MDRVDAPRERLLMEPAAEIATAIKSKSVSALELLEMQLRRIEAANPEINAVVTLTADKARSAAAMADTAIARGHEVGVLHGVPFTVKDVIVTEGIRTTAGSLIFQDHLPGRTATAVERLQRAGAVLVGKTNCPEFALDLNTTNRIFGQTWNPLDLTRTPGGSSGGDSAAVASGCAAFGIGTDYGGSIRWPAHCTGLVSIRPTPGLVPCTGQLPFSSDVPLPPPNSLSLQSQQQMISPIARSIRDLYPILKLMSGPDDLDLHAAPVQLPDRIGSVLPGLGCAWFDGEGTRPVRSDLIAVVADAARCLAEAGFRTTNQRPPGFDEAERVFAALRSAEGVPDHLRAIGSRTSELTDAMRAWITGSRTASVAEYLRLGAQRDLLRSRLLAFMREWPILLLPVASLPAFRVNDPDLQVEGTQLQPLDVHVHCRPISLFRLPAAVVPCGTSIEGLPVGVQVVGRPFAEPQVLAVAELLEHEFGLWKPPLRREGISGTRS